MNKRLILPLGVIEKARNAYDLKDLLNKTAFAGWMFLR